MTAPKTIRRVLLAALLLGSVLVVLSRRPLFKVPFSTVIEDRHGELLSAQIAADGQWRFPQNKDVPDKFRHCITTFEDRRFFWHNGVDVPAAIGALYSNWALKRRKRGASTITMQVMRLNRGKTKRNWYSKIVETAGALWLEVTRSKAEILSLYAAHAPFGGNVTGLEAASWRYYGRPAARLSWGEMSALAVLPNSPGLVHPGRNRNILLSRRNFLLQKLHTLGTIDAAELELAMLEPLPATPLPLPQDAPHLLQYVKKRYGRHQHTESKTTIDQKMQRAANAILEIRHPSLLGNGIKNAAMLVVEVETGHVLAYAGNVYKPQQPSLQSNVDIIQAPRSPGSVLKPILYAASMSSGEMLPHALLPDIPLRIGGYTPQNFDRQYDGAVPASEAISRSLNIPAVKMLQQYKYPKFYELLKKLGITTFQYSAGHYGLSMILGGSEINMWDLAGVYAGMARTVNHAAENNGQALAGDFSTMQILAEEPANKSAKRIDGLDATSVWFAFQAMQELMRPGEEGLWQQFESSATISWKTGTSFGFRDAWAVGVTPRHVVVVWTGNASGEGRAGLTGVQTAAPILFDMFKVLPPAGTFQRPANRFEFLPVCRESGMRASFDCETADTLFMPSAGSLSPPCPYHRVIHLNADSSHQVLQECVTAGEMVQRKWFVLPPAMEWYFSQRHPEYRALPPFLAACGTEATNVELIYPAANARLYIPLELDGSRGKVVFRAAKRGGGRLFWHVDEEFIAATDGFHEIAVSPSPGQHVLTLVTASGERVQRVFTVVEGSGG